MNHLQLTQKMEDNVQPSHLDFGTQVAAAADVEQRPEQVLAERKPGDLEPAFVGSARSQPS